MRTGNTRKFSTGPKSKLAKLAIPIAAGVVIVAAAAGWWFFLRATPEKAIAGYVAAAKTGNEAAAKAFLTADTVKAIDEIQQTMQTQAPQMAGNFKLATSLVGRATQDADVHIGKAKVENGVATVQVTVTRKNAAKGGSPATTSPKGGAPGGAAPGGQQGGGRMGGGRPRDITVKLEGGVWKIDATQQLAMVKQMMTYFAANGGQMGQQGAQGGQGMGRGFGRGMGMGMGMGMRRRGGGQMGQQPQGAAPGQMAPQPQGAAPAPTAPMPPAAPAQ